MSNSIPESYNESLREFYRLDNVCREDIDHMTEEVALLNNQNHRIHQEVMLLTKRNQRIRQEITLLEKQIQRIHRRIDNAIEEVTLLEKQTHRSSTH